MKIELHVLQNFAPSCLNRDDTNTPKDCEFGGVRRARISSQCMKRAIRKYFEENNAVEVGKRTKRLKGELLSALSDLNEPAEDLSAGLDAFLEGYYSKMDSKQPGNTAVLLFVSPVEVAEAAQCVRELWSELKPLGQERRKKLQAKPDEKDLPKAKPDKRLAARLQEAALSSDIALFGRMLAEQTSMSVEAACQVAHAISTHKVDLEMDFYTAVDDLNPKTEPGAGMLGVTGYNSACFYRYALLDRPQLVANLKDEKLADDTIAAFLNAAIMAIPTGKQNSMAAHNRPSFGMFVVRRNGAPCSLANAFAAPVSVGEKTKESGELDEDLIGLSVERLTNYWDRLGRVYGHDGVLATPLFCVDHPDRLNGLAGSDKESMRGAIDEVMRVVLEGATL